MKVAPRRLCVFQAAPRNGTRDEKSWLIRHLVINLVINNAFSEEPMSSADRRKAYASHPNDTGAERL